MNFHTDYQGKIHRSHDKYWEDGDEHDIHEVLTHKETTLRSIVDDRFYWTILPYQHDKLITAAFEIYLKENNLKDFADTCIRFLAHTVVKKQFYSQHELISRSHSNYFRHVMTPLLHTDSMQTAFEEYQEHFQKYVDTCRDVMIKDLLARSKIV